MSIKEFVSKKREMLLLNMKIDTQHENIEKLHRQLKDKEDALNLKEAKLADSMKRFDTFLKETDEKAQNAQRQVERETARRIQKQQDIININNQLKVVQSQISKHNDTLEELSQCKSFMDSITPPSWFDECAAEKRRRQQQRRRYRINARQETFRIEQQKMLEKKGAENNEKRSSSSRRRARKAINSPADKEPLPVPDFEDEPQTSSDEEFPMYFHSSDQLYNQFNELETEHLDLVKIVEEGRDTLSNIQAQIKSITDELESKTGISDVSKTQSQILNEVTATQEVEMKIKEVYKQCHPESDIDSDLPAMISGIRVTMETLLSKVEDMPSEWFKAKLKEMSDD
jgi:chromosome segregation ATPase